MFRRYLLGIGGGAISYFAYPQPAIWPAIFLSIGAIYLALRGLTFWRAIGVGLVSGFAFYCAQIYWISQYLGPEPLIALAGLESLFFAIAAGVIGLITRKTKNPWILSILVATVWNCREWFSTHFPYGGFPWSRVAMSQSNSPLAFWVSVGGFGLLSFLCVGLTVYLVETLGNASKRNVLRVASVSLAVFAIPFTLSLAPIETNGTLKIAGIQGNANAGLFSREPQGTIFENHLEATNLLLESGKSFDLVVWPENASDINPDDDAKIYQSLQSLVDEKLKQPLIFGTITHNDDYSQIFNSSKLWIPGRGEVDQYDKKRPVPFGEYVPDRDFFYALSPDLVGMITKGYTFGTRDGIFEVANTKAGILICFEEAIDELPRDLVAEGATVIIAQTNNADFGHSDESVQQLGIARLRAIETGRSIVNISTVGPSAIITPKGEYLSTSNAYVRDFLLAEVPLSESKNIAMSGGWLFDPITAAAGSAIAIWLFIENRRKTTKL